MAAKYITTTYEIWTPEDVELGEASETGWIDDEGEDMAPDAEDREEGLTAVDKAVGLLQAHYASVGSEGGRGAASRWWTDYGDADPRTGDRENRSYHLEGFSEAERREIQREMERRPW